MWLKSEAFLWKRAQEHCCPVSPTLHGSSNLFCCLCRGVSLFAHLLPSLDHGRRLLLEVLDVSSLDCCLCSPDPPRSGGGPELVGGTTILAGNCHPGARMSGWLDGNTILVVLGTGGLGEVVVLIGWKDSADVTGAAVLVVDLVEVGLVGGALVVGCLVVGGCVVCVTIGAI